MEPEPPILLIAAHPDDEVIGAGIRMSRWGQATLTIVHVTDGSPRDPSHAQAAGFANREDYAAARRRELLEAVALAGIPERNCRTLGFVDQEAYLHLPELIEMIGRIVEELRPRLVYTHPYEGGHPDHDSAAFAVGNSRACATLQRREFTSYHAGRDAGADRLVTGEFLETGGAETLILNHAERELKQRMFDCFRSQQRVLRDFAIIHERFRDAPEYDFTQPPHAGRLHYENLGWNISGENWRARAAAATSSLKVENAV